MSSASLPSEMLTATIITLTKPGKEPLLAQHFKSISRLSVDLKIYAKLLANRISRCLPLPMTQDQVGFVSGHQAPNAMRQILNLLHYAEFTRVAFSVSYIICREGLRLAQCIPSLRYWRNSALLKKCTLHHLHCTPHIRPMFFTEGM